jgi:membrane-bound lytic murein transglycosylase A
VAALLLVSGCAALPTAETAGLTPVAFNDLPGWPESHPAQAMPPLLLTCERLALSPPDLTLGGNGVAKRLGGQGGDWLQACSDARAVPPADDAAARAFFEHDFIAYALPGDVLFTGYDEPQVDGARQRGGPYQTPLLRRPDDLVQATLDDFQPGLAGSISGRVADGRLVPYYDRAAIERGALDEAALSLAWLADPVDAYVLQVQGSGRVRLPDGSVLRLGYAGKNGLPYVPLGRVMVQRGLLPAGGVTMQSVRGWLEAHPDHAGALMDANPSYVFFRVLADAAPDQGPPGTLGVPLTPGRSLAVDRAAVPLGAPVWVATSDPLDGRPLRRLMMAQDTGGAITGPGRADIFFGWGAAAEAAAGRMQGSGKAYVLLPRGAAPMS